VNELLTPERHQMILELLNKNKVVTVHELTEITSSSESTIRRDLLQLEHEGKLQRFHGGAERVGTKSEEVAIQERVDKNPHEKAAIGQFAAQLVESGDCIYLDAGTTTAQMITHLRNDIIVVTNGMTLVEQCLQQGLKTFLIGGEVKATTRAAIGRGALESLETYRFDKCFMGMNGVHPIHGFTTPDPEEAWIKKRAMELSTQRYVLADQTKLGKVSFAHVNSLESTTLITNSGQDRTCLNAYMEKMIVKVVTA
jgi:DeoR family transcriptional regulator, fructose operon transcriptional repressor